MPHWTLRTVAVIILNYNGVRGSDNGHAPRDLHKQNEANDVAASSEEWAKQVMMKRRRRDNLSRSCEKHDREHR